MIRYSRYNSYIPIYYKSHHLQLPSFMQANAEQQNTHLGEFMKQGYQLSQPIAYNMPRGILQQNKLQYILNFLGQQAQQVRIFDKNAIKYCTILSDNVLLLWQSNKLNIVHYNIKNNIFTAQSLSCFLLKQRIKNLKISAYQQKKENASFVQYFIVQYQNSKHFTLFKKNQSKIISVESEISQKHQILCIKFISNLQIVLLLKDNSIIHYIIIEHELKKMRNINKLILREDQRLISAEFCRVLMENKTKILAFYAIYSTKSKKCEIHMKQLQKEVHQVNLHDFGTYYNIFPVSLQQQQFKQLLIYSHKSLLLFHFKLKVYVIQNRFGRFINTDIIRQLTNIKRIAIIDKKEHLFIASVSEDQIQLWHIAEKQVGCKCKLLDKIQTNNQDIYLHIIKIWIFVKHNQPNIALLLDDGAKGVLFYLTKRQDKLTKLVNQVKFEQSKQEISYRNEQKRGGLQEKKARYQEKRNKLKQIQGLSKKLGFQHRQFYLKLWNSVEKTSNRIYEYLLPCLDFSIIYNQLNLYLRRKKLTVSQIIKILKKIQALLLERLEHKIDIQLIKQLLKTNFQRRKLKFYSGDIQFDYHQYQQLYQSSIFDLIHKSIDVNLFPSKFKHNIVWKQQKLETPIPISYILREFRLIILEDYPKFLITVLDPYKLHFKQIIKQYPYLLPQYPLKISIIKEQLVLLSNIYEEQKIQEHQHSWLQFIRQKQWQRQRSSNHFIYNHLFKFHQTSLIVDQLKQLKESAWFKKNKYIKHSFIELNQEEYSNKLPEIAQASSILFFCQKTNRISLDEKIPNQTPQILELIKQKNNLPTVQYQKYNLYSKLHYFLISEKLMNSEITIKELSQMQNYRIIVLFFLGDKLKTYLIFEKLYHFYPSKAQFIKVIEDFIISQECSKIELQILINYIKSMTAQQQHEHLEVIGIVITGFFKKIQLNQKDKARQFLKLFKNIELSTQMIRQIAIFESIKVDCCHILKFFGMGNFTYEEIIHNSSLVLGNLVQEYFTRLFQTKQCLYIEGRQLKLSCRSNLFAIYLYLKDKIYSYKGQLQLHLQFCENIFRWNQIPLFKQCFSGVLIIDQQFISPAQFYDIVVTYMLDKYNSDQNLIYTSQFKSHMTMLLSLLQESSPIAIIQRNKIELANIFQNKLNKNINFQFMEILKEQWRKDEERQSLFKQIIEIFENKMDFRTFCHVYQVLEKTKYGQSEVIIKTNEFIMFVDFYCKNMFKINRYDEICEIIYFLNFKEDSYKARYNVMTQCFLKVLENKLISKKSKSLLNLSKGQIEFVGLQQTKNTIDCYIDNYDDMFIINELFQKQFALDDWSHIYGKNELLLDARIATKQQSLISRTMIWDTIIARYSSDIEKLMAEKVRKDISFKKKGQIEQIVLSYLRIIISSYYFTCKSFTNLQSILNIQHISYFHLENINFLYQLQRIPYFQKLINFKEFYYQYLRALFKYYYLQSINARNEVQLQGQQVEAHDHGSYFHRDLFDQKEVDKKIHDILSMDKTKLLILASDIDKGSNSQLLKAIKRLINVIKQVPQFNDSQVKSKPQIKSLSLLEDMSHPTPNQAQNQHSLSLMPHSKMQHDKQKTYKYVEFSKIKMEYAKGSLTSQKYLIEKVIDQLQLCEQQKNLQKLELIPLSNKIATRLFQDEKQLMENGKDQEEKKIQNIDLSQIYELKYDAELGERIKQLISNRNFQFLRAQYDVNIIYRFIHEEFYCNSETNINKNHKKRLNRVNTLKAVTFSSKIFVLLQLLDDLKLNENNCKDKMLRSCLITLSSTQIEVIQPVLLKLFSLNVLASDSLDHSFIFQNILDNLRSINDYVRAQDYLMVVKVVDLFLFKMKEEKNKKNLQQSEVNVLNSYNSNAIQIGQLYKHYLSKLIQQQQQQDKMQQLQMIVRQIQKEQLNFVHNQILKILEADQNLQFSYLALILDKFGHQFS